MTSPTSAEVSADKPSEAPELKEESTKTEKDTTSQHKSHLFDLHCKICTGKTSHRKNTSAFSLHTCVTILTFISHQIFLSGRMLPPVEEAPTKVVKVATKVVRRQSTKEETKSTTPTTVDDDLHLTVLEESLRNAKSGYEGR